MSEEDKSIVVFFHVCSSSYSPVWRQQKKNSKELVRCEISWNSCSTQGKAKALSFPTLPTLPCKVAKHQGSPGIWFYRGILAVAGSGSAWVQAMNGVPHLYPGNVHLLFPSSQLCMLLQPRAMLVQLQAGVSNSSLRDPHTSLLSLCNLPALKHALAGF